MCCLGDPEAYRRDRRKDALLQEAGYFVLRFLAEDAGKRLDLVLDGILRVVASLLRARGDRENPIFEEFMSRIMPGGPGKSS